MRRQIAPNFQTGFAHPLLLTSQVLYQGLKTTTVGIITIVLGFLTICVGITILQMSKGARSQPSAASLSLLMLTNPCLASRSRPGEARRARPQVDDLAACLARAYARDRKGDCRHGRPCFIISSYSRLTPRC